MREPDFYVDVVSEATGYRLQLPGYYGESIVTGTFSDPNDVSRDVSYVTANGWIVDQVDDQAFKVRETGEILRKV